MGPVPPPARTRLGLPVTSQQIHCRVWWDVTAALLGDKLSPTRAAVPPSSLRIRTWRSCRASRWLSVRWGLVLAASASRLALASSRASFSDLSGWSCHSWSMDAVERSTRRRRIRLRAALSALVLAGIVGGVSVPLALAGDGPNSPSAAVAEWARTHGLGGVVTWMEQVAYALNPPRSGGTVAGGIETPTPVSVATPNAGPSTASAPPGPVVARAGMVRRPYAMGDRVEMLRPPGVGRTSPAAKTRERTGWDECAQLGRIDRSRRGIGRRLASRGLAWGTSS
jgi:hypothetical protein